MEASLISSTLDLLSQAGARPSGPLAIPLDETEFSIRPIDYAAYFDLAIGTPTGEALAECKKAEAERYLIGRLAGQADPASVRHRHTGATASPLVTNLSTDFYTPAEIDRMRRWWDIEPENAMDMVAVSSVQFRKARLNIIHALQMLERCSAHLHKEIVSIINEIVIAKPSAQMRLDFGGASSFALWGGFVVNCQNGNRWLAYFKTIVHEAAHNLLFGLARNEPLVLNAPEDRHVSPLRDDLRPLDGIYHAAFVSARESLALDRLLSWNEETRQLNEEDVDLAESMLEETVPDFWSCARTVRESASLSTLGQSILDECETYMEGSFAVVT